MRSATKQTTDSDISAQIQAIISGQGKTTNSLREILGLCAQNRNIGLCSKIIASVEQSRGKNLTVNDIFANISEHMPKQAANSNISLPAILHKPLQETSLINQIIELAGQGHSLRTLTDGLSGAETLKNQGYNLLGAYKKGDEDIYVFNRTEGGIYTDDGVVVYRFNSASQKLAIERGEKATGIIFAGNSLPTCNFIQLMGTQNIDVIQGAGQAVSSVKTIGYKDIIKHKAYASDNKTLIAQLEKYEQIESATKSQQSEKRSASIARAKERAAKRNPASAATADIEEGINHHATAGGDCRKCAVTSSCGGSLTR